jgi:hypothetical protein
MNIPIRSKKRKSTIKGSRLPDQSLFSSDGFLNIFSADVNPNAANANDATEYTNASDGSVFSVWLAYNVQQRNAAHDTPTNLFELAWPFSETKPDKNSIIFFIFG